MGQTNLADHIDKGPYLELCPQCFKPLTPYWQTVLIEPYEDSNMAVLTMERKCGHCGYTEQRQVEQLKSIICQSSKDNSCDLCVSKCRGGC